MFAKQSRRLSCVLVKTETKTKLSLCPIRLLLLGKTKSSRWFPGGLTEAKTIKQPLNKRANEVIRKSYRRPLQKYFVSPSNFPATVPFVQTLDPLLFLDKSLLSFWSSSPTNPTRNQVDSLLKIAELKGIPAAAEGSNFVFSPLSLRAVLSLTAAGAKGETLRQLLSFLGSPTVDHLHSASARLVEAVRDGEGDDQLLLSFVNGVWVDRSLEVNPSFVRIAASIYDAAADSVDFIHQAPLEQKKINSWIEEKTNGVIKNLIPEGAVKNTTRLILANALYFKGKWQEKFDSSMTENNNFYLLDGNNIVVPFMSSREDQLISSYNGFKVLKLPYKQQGDSQGNIRFSMLLFLPNERNGLHDLIRRAASEPSFFNEHIPFKRVEVHRFMIPKFKISFSCETTDVLSNLGLKSLFNLADVDLSGMCLKSKRLCVSSMHHKAAVEVDEEGTVAAAATSITIKLTCYTPRVNFVADHPFMFILREDATGAIWFFGHVVNPSVVC